jgi:hypothetical protein
MWKQSKIISFHILFFVDFVHKKKLWAKKIKIYNNFLTDETIEYGLEKSITMKLN